MNPRIAIMTGHSGKDPGAIDMIEKSNNDEIYSIEAELNTRIVLKTVFMASSFSGVNFFEVRGSWGNRFEKIAIEVPDLILSIHHNAAYNEGVKGRIIFPRINCNQSEVFALFLKQKSEEYVKEIDVDRLETPMPEWAIFKEEYINPTIPMVLYELGFITNPEEEILLNDDRIQSLTALSIIQAVNLWKVDFWRG